MPRVNPNRMERPRGKCRRCGRECAIKKDGTIQGHGAPGYWGNQCPGSAELPADSSP